MGNSTYLRRRGAWQTLVSPPLPVHRRHDLLILAPIRPAGDCTLNVFLRCAPPAWACRPATAPCRCAPACGSVSSCRRDCRTPQINRLPDTSHRHIHCGARGHGSPRPELTYPFPSPGRSLMHRAGRTQTRFAFPVHVRLATASPAEPTAPPSPAREIAPLVVRGALQKRRSDPELARHDSPGRSWRHRAPPLGHPQPP